MAGTSTAQESTYRTVAYADVFDMPIDLDRSIDLHLGARHSPAEIWQAIDSLTSARRLEIHDNLLCLSGRSKIIDTWHDRQGRVDRMWQDAERWGQILGRVPFVRMVAVTGGLAIDAVGEHDRINYFIVTRPRRLWMTRGLIQIVVQAAKSAGVSISPNYLVTMRALEIPEHSTYVARELAQMAVIVGDELCQSVRRNNAWMFDFVPNASAEGNQTHLSPYRPTRTQRFVERVLLLTPFRIVELFARRRGIAGLSQFARQRDPQAFGSLTLSADVCKEHLPSRAVRIEAAWRRRLRDVSTVTRRAV